MEEVKDLLQQVLFNYAITNNDENQPQIPIGKLPPSDSTSLFTTLTSMMTSTMTKDPSWTQLPDDPFPKFPGQEPDETLALLLPLLILLTTLLFLLLIFLIFLILIRKKRGIVLRDEGGPLNLEQEDEIEGEGGLEGVEQRWLEGVEESTKSGYLRGKVWQSQYPPNSHPTDITLSQFLSIQEKGVSAWSFEPDYESNPALIVQSRTEITFLADGIGMAEEEGGGCCVQSNLPLPRLNEVYYFECKMYEKPVGTEVAIGLATKPFPSFRLPGWSKYSVGYFSSDGFKSHSYPFTSQSYGPPLTEGDVLGVGYRPRTGTVFFTRNGKKLEDAYVGLNRHNLFPTIGANGASTVHVNLGQAGFVFIEANVKKWGLAPMVGTLPGPPAYGSERGSILLETARNGTISNNTTNSTAANGRVTASGTASTSTTRQSSSSSSTNQPWTSRSSTSSSTTPTVTSTTSPRKSTHSSSNRYHHHHHHSKSSRRTSPPSVILGSNSTTPAGAVSALGSPSVSQPIRPSPLRHSRKISSNNNISSLGGGSESPHTNRTSREISSSDEEGSSGGGGGGGGGRVRGGPPTPGLLDISLHSLHHRFPIELEEEGDDRERESIVAGGSGDRNGNGNGNGRRSRSDSSASGSTRSDSSGEEGRKIVASRLLGTTGASNSNVEPPAYHPIDPHVYAPGVGEALLEDVFANVSSRQFAPNIPTNFQNSSTFSEGRYEGLGTGGNNSNSPIGNRGGGNTGNGSTSTGQSWWDWIGARGTDAVGSYFLPISNAPSTTSNLLPPGGGRNGHGGNTSNTSSSTR